MHLVFTRITNGTYVFGKKVLTFFVGEGYPASWKKFRNQRKNRHTGF